MPADPDPIAVLRRTDPAAAVPAPPTLEELASVPAGLTAGRHPAGRRLALAAAVLLVVALAGAAVVVSSDGEERTPVGTSPDATATDAEPPSEIVPEVAPEIDPDDDVPEETEPADPGAEEPEIELPHPMTEGGTPALLPLADPAPARDELLALADRAATDTTPVTPGPVAYRRSISWTEVLGGSDGSAIASGTTHRESWTDADGTAHVEQGSGPQVPEGADVLTGLDPPRPTDAETTEWSHAYIDPADLPDDPAVIDVFLQVEIGPSSDFKYTLERAANLLGDRPRDGADRAAVLRRLAEIEEVRYRGEVVDRAGRPSVAFSVPTDSHGGLMEVVVLLDPETGAFHGREDVLLEDPQDEDAAPRLQWSDTLVDVGNVAAVGDRPA